MDGKKQRNALTGAEQSLRALAAGDSARARKNAAKAADLDQLGLFADLPAKVAAAADDIETSGVVSSAKWDDLRAVVGAGPLQFLIDELRS